MISSEKTLENKKNAAHKVQRFFIHQTKCLFLFNPLLKGVNKTVRRAIMA